MLDVAAALIGSATNPVIQFGQCFLTKRDANIVLLPHRGNRLTVNGQACTIPAAGVSLSPNGLVPGTNYYIYATATNGVVDALEASVTWHSTDLIEHNYGVEIKNDDRKRSLVGFARVTTGTVFADSPTQRFVRSWFNDSGVQLSGPLVSKTSATNTFVEVSISARADLLAWENEVILVANNGYGYTDNQNSPAYSGIGIDSSATNSGDFSVADLRNANTGLSCSTWFALTEGYHFITPTMHSTGGYNAFVASAIRGMTIRRR